MTIIITNALGLFTFCNAAEAAEFRHDMVYSLNEAAFQVAYNTSTDLQFSNLSFYWEHDLVACPE